jgi:hypothetical protein
MGMQCPPRPGQIKAANRRFCLRRVDHLVDIDVHPVNIFSSFTIAMLTAVGAQGFASRDLVEETGRSC